VDGTRMVPVSKVSVYAGGASPAQGTGGFGGGGKAELAGLYVVDAAGRERWLPVLETPPDGFKDWDSWLRSRPDLMEEIHRSLGR